MTTSRSDATAAQHGRRHALESMALEARARALQPPLADGAGEEARDYRAAFCATLDNLADWLMRKAGNP